MKARCFKILGIIALAISIAMSFHYIIERPNEVQIIYIAMFLVIGIALLGIYFFRIYVLKEKDTCISRKNFKKTKKNG